MKTHTLDQFAPDVRGRGRTAFANDHIHSDLAELGAAFAGGELHAVAFELSPEAGLVTLAEVYAYRIFRAKRVGADGRLVRLVRLVLRFARDGFVIVHERGDGCIYAGSEEKARALFAELEAVLGEAPETAIERADDFRQYPDHADCNS